MARPTDPLIKAAAALAWSDRGTAAQLRDEPSWERLYEPWPEMDTLIAALDQRSPGWREATDPRRGEEKAGG